jgi:hypothetical protein
MFVGYSIYLIVSIIYVINNSYSIRFLSLPFPLAVFPAPASPAAFPRLLLRACLPLIFPSSPPAPPALPFPHASLAPLPPLLRVPSLFILDTYLFLFALCFYYILFNYFGICFNFYFLMLIISLLLLLHFFIY